MADTHNVSHFNLITPRLLLLFFYLFLGLGKLIYKYLKPIQYSAGKGAESRKCPCMFLEITGLTTSLFVLLLPINTTLRLVRFVSLSLVRELFFYGLF